jgi:hypothetical protein
MSLGSIRARLRDLWSALEAAQRQLKEVTQELDGLVGEEEDSEDAWDADRGEEGDEEDDDEDEGYWVIAAVDAYRNKSGKATKRKFKDTLYYRNGELQKCHVSSAKKFASKSDAGDEIDSFDTGACPLGYRIEPLFVS